jgi:poly(3-hydroxybutyrate) depolymerase
MARATRLFVLLTVVAAALACGRGRGGGGGGGEKGHKESPGKGGPRFQQLSEVFGGDGCATPSRTGALVWDVDFGGKTWKVPIWLPDNAGPRNAVFLLHGFGGGGTAFARNSGYDELTQARGAILVAPDAAWSENPSGFGGEEFWDNGRYKHDEREFPRDDVAFLDALAKSLRSEACVADVLATGFSNGAAMSLAWACRSGEPDAVVAAAGTLMETVQSCKQVPVPVRIYIGDKDERYDGSARPERPEYPSSQKSAALFAAFNGCEQTTRSVDVAPDTACKTWDGCKAPVELCVIRGMGHAVPTGPGGKPSTGVNFSKDGYAWFLTQVGGPEGKRGKRRR